MHVIHIRGTVGPIYRAVLRVLLERDRGVPDAVSVVQRREGLLISTTSLGTARLVAVTLADTHNAGDGRWPWLGDCPSSLEISHL